MLGGKQAGEMDFQLDLTKPLYEQVIYWFRRAIARGELELGSKMPSVRELAQQLKVNPNTVMRAYQELERDGLCETRRGQGTFITSAMGQVTAIKNDLAGGAIRAFIIAMKELGIDRETAQKLLQEVSGNAGSSRNVRCC